MSIAKQIADYFLQNDNYYILVHKNPDGDCLGSSKALCLALRSIDKKAKVILPNEVSPRLLFMWNKELEQGEFPCECAVCVDVASIGQMGSLYESHFKNAARTVCIDHHGTNEGYAQLNYIDEKSAATGEMIYEIINHLGIKINETIAEALLISVADDTGSFQYSNTSARTHHISSKLYEVLSNPEPVMRALYGTHSRGEIIALQKIAPSMEFFCDGKVCMVFVDVAEIVSLGADSSNIDAWVGLPRSVVGVEVAAVFKIHSDSEVKVSLRSNDYVDVSLLAAKFGGGGHQRAAGVTFTENVNSAKEKLLEELKKLV